MLHRIIHERPLLLRLRLLHHIGQARVFIEPEVPGRDLPAAVAVNAVGVHVVGAALVGWNFGMGIGHDFEWVEVCRLSFDLSSPQPPTSFPLLEIH